MEFLRIGTHNLPVPARLSGLPIFELRTTQPLFITPDHTQLVDCGFDFRVPNGYAGLISSEPYLADATGAIVAASPHLIVPQGEPSSVKFSLRNTGKVAFSAVTGAAVARLTIVRIMQTDGYEVDAFAGS